MLLVVETQFLADEIHVTWFKTNSWWWLPSGKLTFCYGTWSLSSLIYPLKIVIFHSFFVCLAEGKDFGSLLPGIVVVRMTMQPTIRPGMKEFSAR
jgi:hypothetical protein